MPVLIDVALTTMRLTISNALAGQRHLMCNGFQGGKAANGKQRGAGKLHALPNEGDDCRCSFGWVPRPELSDFQLCFRRNAPTRLHKAVLHVLPLKPFFELFCIETRNKEAHSVRLAEGENDVLHLPPELSFCTIRVQACTAKAHRVRLDEGEVDVQLRVLQVDPRQAPQDLGRIHGTCLQGVRNTFGVGRGTTERRRGRHPGGYRRHRLVH